MAQAQRDDGLSQKTFDFDGGPRGGPPEERERLGGQQMLIVERLRRGPATNDELMMICRSRNLTARISTLRKNGVVIECFDHDRRTGVAWYRLISEPTGGDR